MIRREVNRTTAITAATTRSVLAGLLLLFVGAVTVAMSRSLGRRTLERYRLILSADSIAVRSDRVLANTELAREEVASVEERQGMGIAVRGRDRRLIGVPSGIDGYEAIRDTMQSWRPIEVKARSHVRVRSPIASIASVAAMMAIIVFSDPRVVVPIAAALALALVASVILVLRNRAVGARMKALMLVSLVPLAAIIARIVQVLTP